MQFVQFRGMNPVMEGNPPRILVVIPAYQEERSIGELVRSLRGRYPHDVLVVNDGSTDRTSENAREAGAIVLDLPWVLEPILAGRADAVIGSRFLGETGYRGSIPRIFGIGFFRLLVNLTTGYRVTDPTSGFFAVNRSLIEFYSHHYPSDYPEVDAYILMHRLGARAEEVPVRMYSRAEGKSSITTFRAVYYMVKVTLSFLINRIRRFG